MSYYHDKQSAFTQMEGIIKKCGKKGAVLCVLIYQLTNAYPVSDLAIKKRLLLLQELGNVEQKDNRVFWINGKGI